MSQQTTTHAEQVQIQADWSAEQAQKQAEYVATMDEVWARRMGPYTDRTLTDVYENVYVNWENKTKKKSLTLNERYIIWKIKSLNWEKMPNYYPALAGIYGWVASANPFCVAGQYHTEQSEVNGRIVKADCGMTFPQWLQYRKDNKIRTFI